jgi:hypothetical protein
LCIKFCKDILIINTARFTGVRRISRLADLPAELPADLPAFEYTSHCLTEQLLKWVASRNVLWEKITSKIDSPEQANVFLHSTSPLSKKTSYHVLATLLMHCHDFFLPVSRHCGILSHALPWKSYQNKKSVPLCKCGWNWYCWWHLFSYKELPKIYLKKRSSGLKPPQFVSCCIPYDHLSNILPHKRHIWKKVVLWIKIGLKGAWFSM